VAGCSTARGRPEGGAPGRMKSGGVQSTDSGLQGDVRAGLGGEVSRSKCPVSGFGGVQVEAESPGPLLLHHVPGAHGVEEAEAGVVHPVVGVARVDGLQQVPHMAHMDPGVRIRSKKSDLSVPSPPCRLP
jgi:hypothetical protein